MNRRAFLKVSLAAPFLAFPAWLRRGLHYQQLATGHYQQDAIQLAEGEGLEAAPGATVIYTRKDGGVPHVFLSPNSRISGIWFVGWRATTQAQGRPVWTKDHAVVENCVFANYFECINVAGGRGVTLHNNGFVNCGNGGLFHPLYLNNMNAAEGEGTTVTDNVFAGGEGYPVHLWHSPKWNSITRNFIGGGLRGIAAQGNNNTFLHNVIWSSGWPSLYMDRGTDIRFNRNLFGPGSKAQLFANLQSPVLNANGFIAPATPTLKAVNNVSPHPNWTGNKFYNGDDAAVIALVGFPAYKINGWVLGLIRDFSQSPEYLLASAGIVRARIAMCRKVVANWAAVNP